MLLGDDILAGQLLGALAPSKDKGQIQIIISKLITVIITTLMISIYWLQMLSSHKYAAANQLKELNK